jgi:hypothetical protein
LFVWTLQEVADPTKIVESLKTRDEIVTTTDQLIIAILSLPKSGVSTGYTSDQYDMEWSSAPTISSVAIGEYGMVPESGEVSSVESASYSQQPLPFTETYDMPPYKGAVSSKPDY